MNIVLETNLYTLSYEELGKTRETRVTPVQLLIICYYILIILICFRSKLIFWLFKLVVFQFGVYGKIPIFLPFTVSAIHRALFPYAKRHRTTNTNKNKRQVKAQTINQLWVYICTPIYLNSLTVVKKKDRPIQQSANQLTSECIACGPLCAKISQLVTLFICAYCPGRDGSSTLAPRYLCKQYTQIL